MLTLQIDADDLSRKSAVLACRRFQGSHTFDRIADMLEGIHGAFDLNSQKVTATITDNASNFIDVFRVFNVKVPSHEEHHEPTRHDQAMYQQYPDYWHQGSQHVADPALQDDEEITFLTPYNPQHNVQQIKLPHHLRCTSHMLGLVCTTDAAEALNASSAYMEINHAAMGKCSALWMCAGKPKLSDVVRYKLDSPLKYPCATRWSSMYDSVKAVVVNKTKINSAMHSLNLPTFEEVELEFLEEYCTVLEPLVAASTQLLGVEGCFYGDLIPTILVTELKLNKLHQESSLQHCAPLLHSVSSGFRIRFGKYLSLDPEVDDAIIASMSHPFFKLRWLSFKKDVVGIDHEALMKRLQDKLVSAVKLCDQVANSLATAATPAQDEHCAGSSSNFFFFESPVVAKHEVSAVETQAINFLMDTGSAIKTLASFPAVKKVFLKYNATLPSSIPVEKLFPFQEMIHSPGRARVSDKLYENFILLKGNKSVAGNKGRLQPAPVLTIL